MKRYRNIKLDSDVNEEEEFSFDDLEDFTMDEEEEMIPTVTFRMEQICQPFPELMRIHRKNKLQHR